ncbi:hypothetical protein [Occallatibacter riparius]|uniref:Uncharacterized protein n=1 Tax=Occallatibacter riparius TaxID=1002689 RepID=A0A9J7BLM5_9BACT|nr:hypothetical protein [Occallatibacter riparius]UWZ83555.1 hypothetical protein MOP44_23680 [Occallatibacter riparius]
MATLSILLGDGFRDDDVLVKIEGRDVARKSHATTDLRTSSAGYVEVSLSQAAQLTIEVPRQGLTGVVDVDVEVNPFLAVSIESGALVFRKSDKPFRLM